MSKLHDGIMNLPILPELSHLSSEEQRLAYKIGHRDARHAAAELALEADRQHDELKESLKQMINLAELSQGLDVADWQAIERARATLKETES